MSAWESDVNNFRRQFGLILERAAVKKGTFHDLRKTAIRNWFAQGLKEFEVMKLAGHADFKTTHKFYLAVADDLKDRARKASARGLCQKLVQIGARGIRKDTPEKEGTVSCYGTKA